MNPLSLTIEGDAKLVVPSSLQCITTYVLLEQEAWFEKECKFVTSFLKPGMNVIDIGANLGVYAVPAAIGVGATGRVYAYEPAAESRNLLEESRRANDLANLEILSDAISDSRRDGHLVHGTSGELHSLSGSGAGEAVSITSLDEESKRLGWTNIDFVKIDAEGEETRILLGGANFFAAQSPLVMFEVKGGEDASLGVLPMFEELGYRIFRAVLGEPLLVPFDSTLPLDVFELNLFAAKPDRARRLFEQGLLIEKFSQWTPDDDARARALEVLKEKPFASAFEPFFAEDHSISDSYRDRLAGFAVWRDADRPLGERYAALLSAQSGLLALAEREPTLARLSTLARASWELGFRGDAVRALYRLADSFGRPGSNLSEPFWPTHPRFDAIEAGKQVREWFVASVMEQLVRAERYSGLFGSPPVDLTALERNPFVAPEIVRRRILAALRSGKPPPLPEILRHRGPGHLNAKVWRAGAVPGL
jgi:FkbM family methyltransferase